MSQLFAVSQAPMAFDVESNLNMVRRHLEIARRRGVGFVTFPELTLTGLHSRIREAVDRTTLDAGLVQISQRCAALGVGAAIGAPVWENDKQIKPFAGLVAFDAEGRRVGVAYKARLMPPGEPVVFEPGFRRDVFTVPRFRLAAVLCREILDINELSYEIADEVNMLLWPGSLARPDLDTTNPDDYTKCAIEVARHFSAWILHANWAWNVERRDVANTGKSLVIDPDGTIVFEAPEDTPGMIIGEGGMWEWTSDA